MLLFVMISVGLAIFILSLHHRRHYKCGICTKRLIQSLKCLNCISIDDGHGFLPLSFLYYLIFMIFIWFLILFKIILISNSFPDQLYEFSYLTESSNFKFNYSFNSIHDYNTNLYVLDIILIYGIIILSSFNSLFVFYTYHTTIASAVHLMSLSAMQIIKVYLLYCIPFIIVFILQVHVYYYLFPILIIMHLSCNMYWTMKFSSTLINRFVFFVEKNELGKSNCDTEMIIQLYYMRKVSLISIILQSISISMFVIIYDTYTIYYVSILWSVSSILTGMQFARNRRYIFSLKTKKCCKYKLIKSSKPNKHETNSKHLAASIKSSVVNVTPTPTPTPTEPIQPTPTPSDNSSSSHLSTTKKDLATLKLKTSKSAPVPRTNPNKIGRLGTLNESHETDHKVGINRNLTEFIHEIFEHEHDGEKEESLSSSTRATETWSSLATRTINDMIRPYDMLTKHGLLATSTVHSTRQQTMRQFTVRHGFSLNDLNDLNEKKLTTQHQDKRHLELQILASGSIENTDTDADVKKPKKAVNQQKKVRFSQDV